MEALSIILLFLLSLVICATYLLCLVVITTAIVIVVESIIYGVVHGVLEIIRILKNK